MEIAHAFLSPSSSEIWLTCTRAPRFAAKFKKKASIYAEEGTLAHELCRLLLEFALKRVTKVFFQTRLAWIKSNELYKPEMLDHANGYCDYVLSYYYKELKRGHVSIYIEQRVDLSERVRESFGHIDAVIVSSQKIAVFDFKYGEGIKVSAVDNSQLKLYALGSLDRDIIGGILAVEMHIYQPRLDNIDSCIQDSESLYFWAENVVKRQSELAFAGKGEFVPGDHCRFCAGKVKCKALAEFNIEIARDQFLLVDELSDDEISEIILNASQLITWLNSIKDYAIDQAKKGKKYPGLKLVKGRSNRAYVSGIESTIKEYGILEEAGYSVGEYMKPAQLIGIGEMEKLLGPTKFNQLLGKFIVKPPGTPALVPESDPRPAIGSAESAKQDFKSIKTKKNG